MQTFSITDAPPSTTVVEAIAESTAREHTDLAPLHEVIDPEALDRFYQSAGFESTTFVYEGYSVTVRADGEVTLSDAESFD